MSIELRIVSGARTGHAQTFEKSVIAVGRHPMSDLRFDLERDLDVSTRHAEIRGVDGRYVLHDNTSTNGTWVNGRAMPSGGTVPIHNGDVVSFGEHGPRLEVHIPDALVVGATRVDPSRASAGAPPASAWSAAEEHDARASSASSRRSTAERVAVAVRQHTLGLQRMLGAALALLVVGVGAAYWVGHRQASKQVAQLMQLVAENESTEVKLQAALKLVGDTSFVSEMRRHNAALRTKAQAADGAASPQQIEALKEELHRSQVVQQGLVGMDLSTISEKNDAAVAFIASELDGKAYGGTAFGVTSRGLLVTNRHNVRSDAGNPPTRIAVMFANTSHYLHARVVRVSEDSAVDLALVQIEESGRYPTVSGVERGVSTLKVGASVVTIGFPHSLDTPMDGDTLRTSLEAGTISKRLPAVLQIDSYAGHGSSGSPIFDVRGYVVGILFGGERESQGRIVYAVPSDKLAQMLPADSRAVLR